MGSLNVLSNPSTIPHIEGMKVGTLTVDSFARRDASDFKFNIRCTRCGDRWTESYRRIMDGFLHQGCRNTTCRLNRLPESKVSAHEKWLNEPEPLAVTQSEPVKPEPVRVEQVSTDYLRYVAICTKVGQADIRTWNEFKNFGSFMHKNVMAQVEQLEEKYG
jgi:hypothetical protein